jgi:hypothetical protein
MIQKNILGKSKAKLLSFAGVSTNHLKIIHNRSGHDGLYILLRKLISAPEKPATDIARFFETIQKNP